MTDTTTAAKPREYANRFFDATAWNGFAFRDDDIVIASYAKAGTTWLQQLVAQLIFAGKEDIDVSAISPWMDGVYPDKATKHALLDAQTHRRLIKTHLPGAALVFSERAKYLYIGRDGRDIALSLYDHQFAVSQDAQARLDAEGDGGGKLRVIAPPSLPIAEYVAHWLARDGAPFWPFWENVRSWRQLSSLPNVMLVHYADLLRDLPGQARRIAAFLEIEVRPDHWDAILAHCDLDYMRQHAARYVPQGSGLWREGGKAFFSRGRHGHWREVLPTSLQAAYEERAQNELGNEGAHWLAKGQGQDA